MRHKRYLFDAAAFLIFIAILIIAVSCALQPVTAQGGYPGPTAYPGPATNTPAAPTSTPRPTRTPVPTGTPVCEDCQPTAVTLLYFGAADTRDDFWWGLFAAVLLATMYAYNWRR